MSYLKFKGPNNSQTFVPLKHVVGYERLIKPVDSVSAYLHMSSGKAFPICGADLAYQIATVLDVKWGGHD